MSRIEVILKNPNPLFEKWLMEWLHEAREKNLRSVSSLNLALDSLKLFPLPLMSGRECAILRGFGPTLCALLDQKLNEYKKSDIESFNRSMNYNNEIIEVTNKVKKKNKRRKVSPKKNSPVKPKTKKSKLDLNEENKDIQIVMNPGNFEVVLIVDTQETSGKYKTILDETRGYLEKRKIRHEVRRLSVGDFAWICRDNKNNELILPYVVERKRMDDFAGSIRDGRFHEQKFRLRNSGIENIIYLIENYGNNKHVGLPLPNLMQAAINTQLHSCFQIKFTDNHRDSMFYLTTLTKILIKNFKDKILICTEKNDLQQCSLESSIVGLMNFNAFQEDSCKTKNVKVREIFVKQLLQLKSLSVDKALAITQIYPTPQSLFLAYQNCDNKDDAEKLLANISAGKLNRPVGVSISKTIYQFYNEDF